MDFEPLVKAAGYEIADVDWTHASDDLRELIDVHDTAHLYRKVR